MSYDPIYDGAFHINDTPARIRRARPKPGEIMRHTYENGEPDGKLTILCPYCGVMFWFVNKVMGPDDAPTLATPVTCTCRTRCARTFRIRSGRLHPDKPLPREKVEIPDDLRKMGVHEAPKLEIKQR